MPKSNFKPAKATTNSHEKRYKHDRHDEQYHTQEQSKGYDHNHVKKE